MPDDYPERGIESRFLHGLYPDLSTSADVGHIALQAGVPNTAPSVDKIEAYLEYLEDIEGSDEQGTIIDEIVESSIRKHPASIPINTPAYREVRSRIIDETGDLDPSISNYEAIERIRHKQRNNLRSWTDYLYDEQQDFPSWFRFYVINDLVRMAPFNEEKGVFLRRNKDSNLMFPQLDQEALAETRDTVMNILAGEDPNIPEEISRNPRFRNIYSHHYNNLRSIPEEELQITDGKWAVFEMGSDPAVLAETLSGKGAGWCLAVYSDANRYLKKGDVMVYFSENKDGKTVNPRIAIAMESVAAMRPRSHIKPGQEDKKAISEVRGILPDQEMEPAMFDIIEEKLKELESGGEVLQIEGYIRRLPHLRTLAGVQEKIDNNGNLTNEELALIYGIPHLVFGFGNSNDLLESVRSGRNRDEDFTRLFNCKAEQVAFGRAQLSEQSLVYVESPFSMPPSLLPSGLRTVIGNLLTTELRSYSLGNIYTIWGNLSLSSHRLKSLGKLRMISESLTGPNDGISLLDDLGDLEFIGGTAELNTTQLTDLRNLRFIGGDARFPHLTLEAFEGLEYVGGNATVVDIPEADFRKLVHVKGEVRVVDLEEYNRDKSIRDEYIRML